MNIKILLKKLFTEDYGLVFVSLGGLFSTVLGAFFWFIFATILNVDNYGLVNFYFAIATIFAGVGTLGLNVTITTFLAKGEKKLLYQANSLILLTATIAALILSTFHWISGLLSITIIFSAMSIAELFGKKLYMEYSFAAVGQRIAQIILGILFYFQFGLMGILAGYFLATLLFSYRYLLSLKHLTTKITALREKRNFILHNYGYELIGETLSNNLDKVIIGTVFGYFTLGLYQLGFQFFMFLNIIPIILAQYLLPEESSGKQKNQIKIIGIITSICFSIVMFFFSPYLIERFFPSFLEAIPLIQTITLAVIPSTIVAITKTALLCKEKTKPVFISSIIYLISLVLCIITLGITLGITGLALAILTSKTIQATYLFTQK
jgi:O-antigen/teichoic acid export membrane protein